MDISIVLFVSFFAFMALKASEQKQHIAALGSYLQPYQIEKLMQNVIAGYMRALDENEPDRRAQIWAIQASVETSLVTQFSRLAADMRQLSAQAARISRLPLAIPLLTRFMPAMSFDLRQAMAVHANGLAHVRENSTQLTRRQQAHCFSAELFLFQHTCHWFCRSKTVASARLLLQHKTTYEQVLAAVSPQTRQAYQALVG